MKKSKTTISFILAIFVMSLFGLLYPLTKIGYMAFDIQSDAIPDILLLAGLRFVVCGLIVCAYSFIKKEHIAAPKGKNVFNIFILGLVSIVLHYAFTYIGLSTTDSSKTALIKQLGVLLYVCFAFLFFKDEKFSVLKIVGGIVGFCGIIAINYTSGGVAFSSGDLLIIGASVCTVASNILSKYLVDDNSPFWITGISQLTGGIVLLAAALIMGGTLPTVNLFSVSIFVCICAASIVSYTMCYALLRTFSLSKMFIIKFSEPLFACLFGAVLLGENIFKVQYLLAFVLISLGIFLGNRSEAK